MSDRHNEPVNILLVEDDSIDVKAFQRAMGKLKISNPVAVARDGPRQLSSTNERTFL